jgi:pimeloyl-ACP methyl ester carboxylesterase|uniref:Alpha/beta fold hydrolase n=1 Tax=Desulfobacca acetoxidans TaxID=60893 RepID=A0A7V6DNP3_9BACT
MTRTWFCEQAGQGFPLVLLHGLGASSFSWRSNIGPLSRHYQVIAPDLPAHGRTPPDAVPDFELATLRRELVHLLDRLGVAQAALAGNSLGGALALLLARDYRERFPALVLLAPAVAVARLPWHFYPVRLPFLGKALAALLGPWTVRLALHQCYYRWDLITPEVVAGYEPTFGTLANRLALRRLICGLDPLPAPRLRDLLAQVPQPLCLIWGARDRILSPQQGVWLQEHLPCAGLKILPEVGHAPQEEAPELVNEIIIAFLKRSLKND